MKKLLFLFLVFSQLCLPFAAAAQTNTRANNIFMTGQLSQSSVAKAKRDCRVDGLVADGVTNDRVALNNCLANAYTNGQNVQLPSGRIHVSGGAINDTNKPGMNITGVQANEDFSTFTVNNNYGTGITQIMCDTGTTVCWDMTGSGGQEIKHIALRSSNGYATPSGVGFLLGRDNVATNGSSSGGGTFCFSANNIFNNVWVYFDSRPAATALGTVPVYNMGSETFSVIGGGYLGDMGFMFGTANVLTVSSPFQTLGTGCPQSMTEIHFQHANIGAFTGDAIRFDDQVADFETDASTEYINLSPGTNHNPAFSFNASSFQNNIFMRGQVENFDFPVAIAKNADRWNMNLLVGGNLAGAGLIQWAANSVSITDSNINFQITNGTAVPLIASSGCTGCTIKGSIINEGGLTGTGTGASGTTLSTSTIYADGLTDANVNTFQAGSQYDLFDASGRSEIGILRTPGNVVRLAGDFTSANAAGLQVITGLSFSLPAVAINYAFHCSLMYSQATNVAGDQFGVASLTTAPTNISTNSAVYQNVGATTTVAHGLLATLATTTPTAIVTFQPATTGNLGAMIDGVIEASGSGASTLQWYVLNGTAADVIVVKKDSFCTLAAQ